MLGIYIKLKELLVFDLTSSMKSFFIYLYQLQIKIGFYLQNKNKQTIHLPYLFLILQIKFSSKNCNFGKILILKWY